MILKLVGLVIAFSIIIFIDLNKLQSADKYKKAIGVYFVILTFGFVLGLLLIIDKAPPSPATYIENAIDILLSR